LVEVEFLLALHDYFNQGDVNDLLFYDDSPDINLEQMTSKLKKPCHLHE
jgi:hypothetical protein